MAIGGFFHLFSDSFNPHSVSSVSHFGLLVPPGIPSRLERTDCERRHCFVVVDASFSCSGRPDKSEKDQS
ncbi:unnamed protein product [Protopolystoma xenopodis]|uniref:Uncharacterized protein n=1 Tax=Protopolystoma xenopodis TaxID=117903 RepID=A0A3S5CJ98_9PLAT|nr:unnamed protein product [Protopolystoma xenopodis]